VEIGIGMGGDLVVTGSGAIYRDREPSALTLRVTGEGWTDLHWSVDGQSRGTGTALTIGAEDYSEARHIAALTASHGGKPYAAVIPVTVTREWAEAVWTQTKNDSSATVFDMAAWENDGPTETWFLSVIEQPVVYFGVRTPPQAVVTLRDAAGAAVRKAGPGEPLDGSFPDSLLDLFAVSPGGDALFEGGDCRVTLTVSEPGRQDKTVNVRVAVRPELTGIAVFRRTDGTLTRITAQNAADHANALYAEHAAGSFPGWGIDFAHVQNLSTALKWLDSYALSGTGEHDMAEYLVRVEADEAMPKTLISCRMNASTGFLAEYIRIRIRGYGGERRIIHDPLSTYTGDVLKGKSVMTANEAFLSIGPQTDSTYEPNHLEVRLEKNITIDAVSGTDPYFPYPAGPPTIISMAAVSWGNTLVMEAGSKLTNYTNTVGMPYPLYDFTAVYIKAGGVFELRGGEIANILGDGNIVLCHDGIGTGTSAGPGRFIYYDGVFSGNTGDQVGIGDNYDPARYDVTDPRFAP
jgi:hypothetical protein